MEEEQPNSPTEEPAQSSTSTTELVGMVATPTLLPHLPTNTPASTPAGTPTPSPSPSATPEPSPTPLPEERLEMAQVHLTHHDFDAAAREFQASLSSPGTLSREQQEEALWGLSLAYLRDDRFDEAVEALNRYRELADSSAEGPDTGSQPGAAAPETGSTKEAEALFHQAEAYRKMGDCAQAVPNYERALQSMPELAAYIHPLIAQCRLGQGDTQGAITAYEEAAAAPAHRLTEVEIRQELADLYAQEGNLTAAIEQYDAIHDLAQTENTRGQMTYLAGKALLDSGDQAAAFERFMTGVNEYPRAYQSYLGLVELVDAGQTVDPFQRGLVDYYADAFLPAIAAFESYIQSNAQDYRPDTHLYLAWSYEAVGNLEAALNHLQLYGAITDEGGATPHAAEAALERGQMYARAGQNENAMTTYLGLVESYPQTAEAQEAAWSAAKLAESMGNLEQARQLYWQLAETYPGHEQAPRALFEAGMMAHESDATGEAQQAWQALADGYPANEYGAAALIWLMRTLPEDEAQPYVITATQLSGAGYYPLRARELAQDVEPFSREGELALPDAEEDGVTAAERQEAEAWLASWLGVEEETVSSELSPELAQDPRMLRGELLWRLGLYEDGKRELEAVRQDYARDAVASYQLALRFRDIGIYRSSIIAADSVLLLSGQSVFEAPPLIGRLSYPVYYSDIILSLAEEYGYDPLLQFALVRQESLFESFIASYVGAQGLSQVMPATGEYIAQRLGLTEYENQDLYRPRMALVFGAYYLQEQLNTFDGDVHAALSAYNAGPGNAARWHAAAGNDLDLYLETVDFSETRTYIQRIYSGYVIYRHLYTE
jgi:soluble lytic murein transglycosylase